MIFERIFELAEYCFYFPANRTLFLRTLAHNQFIMMHKAWRLGDTGGIPSQVSCDSPSTPKPPLAALDEYGEELSVADLGGGCKRMKE